MRKFTDKGIEIDGYLKARLDTTVYNIKNDWDCVWIVCSQGKTRVGKTVLAQQAAYYAAERLGVPFTSANIVFFMDDLLEMADKCKRTPIILDESRSEVTSSRSNDLNLQNMLYKLDLYAKNNNFIIIIAHHFFSLPRALCIGRARLLINVKEVGNIVSDELGNKVESWDRGLFEFWGEEKMTALYLKGMKLFSYRAVRRTGYGFFKNKWTIDELEYTKKKENAIGRFKQKEKDERLTSKRFMRLMEQRDKALRFILDLGYSGKDVESLVGISKTTALRARQTATEPPMGAVLAPDQSQPSYSYPEEGVLPKEVKKEGIMDNLGQNLKENDLNAPLIAEKWNEHSIQPEKLEELNEIKKKEEELYGYK